MLMEMMMEQAKTPKPTRRVLDALSDHALIMRTTSRVHMTWRQPYCDEINRRTAENDGARWTLQVPDDDGDDDGPRPRRKQRVVETSWNTDRALAKSADWDRAITLLCKDVMEYWPEDNIKDPEEIQGFLQDILDEAWEWDDLTDGQRKLLGMVRRLHAKWVRKRSKHEASEPF